MGKVIVINGPNLNLLGIRDKELYGEKNLEQINKELQFNADKHECMIEFFQSNHEGEIIDAIHNVRGYTGIIINAGGYTHTSVAIRDAIEAINVPAIEVHISNIYQREDFRRKSIIATACLGQITGLGWYGYLLALNFFCRGSAQ
ncbi:type II 3-dehydroquinate dehydratase [candidate division WOR-3 bacterium RBG_13_43_14]|uniref:3-dehydroquinate dehydratase n=1 Tax=candidate division WOR-3 bacterium RBG_13_43_14 TaxID=1802590 RepID=A0A1F4U233_UNCW3|nr:MAG: type II 3-dehydroquinate dehydratase [candidate division WOR-3 bacterium RBG_13_43_14]